MRMGFGANDSLDTFGEHMSDADLAGMSLERERLHFERYMGKRNKKKRGQEGLEGQREMEQERRENNRERVE